MINRFNLRHIGREPLDRKVWVDRLSPPQFLLALRVERIPGEIDIAAKVPEQDSKKVKPVWNQQIARASDTSRRKGLLAREIDLDDDESNANANHPHTDLLQGTDGGREQNYIPQPSGQDRVR